MAIACGLAVANVYYNQPMLEVIKQESRASSLPAMIPTATQIGYAIGLFLLVPMGDFIDRRRLIVVQFIVLGVALVASATAPNAGILLIASVFVGVAATVTQQIIPFAASLASPERRGRVVGTVMSRLLCGILISRTRAGFIASHFRWHLTFWVAIPLASVCAVMMALTLPRHVEHARLYYLRTLGSLFQLWGDESGLRLAPAIQAALFAAFTAFWTILAFHLEEPGYRLGPDIAGLFGIIERSGYLPHRWPVVSRTPAARARSSRSVPGSCWRRGPYLGCGAHWPASSSASSCWISASKAHSSRTSTSSTRSARKPSAG